MAQPNITDKALELAQVCLNCPVYGHVRSKQQGAVYWFVQNVEGSLCPSCQAYERVYGKQAHELRRGA